MSVFNPALEPSILAKQLQQTNGLVVACYCAQWCDTCKQYLQPFQALSERWPQHTFIWIDIEECESLLDDEEIENFPTLLLQGPNGNLFFGPMVPYIEQLEKLLQRTNAQSHGTAGGPHALKELLEKN